jgi:Restriction Endonuclease associating with ARP
MGGFLESEKRKQAEFKARSTYFSESARLEGVYKGKPRPFCVPIGYAEQNLFPEIRKSALSYFAEHGIKWHDGQNGKSSNHLCDSQVCCVNFLFPFAEKPVELAQVLRPIFPKLEKTLSVESKKYVSFEWIGQENYLGEKISRNGQRTRGANFTSADSIVMFEREDKKRQVVLIEWKYTESYGGTFLKISRGGTDRTSIYRHLFESTDCPIRKDILPSFDALFYEPFYQFMRQQFLASEMEKAHEMGADIVSLLHIAPAHNINFRKVTSPELVELGDSTTSIWNKLVIPEKRFTSVSTEQLFGNLSVNQLPGMKSWLEYIQARYAWVCLS